MDSVKGDETLFLNALGADARKASERFRFNSGSQFKGSSYWWVTVANVVKWVTVNDQAVHEKDGEQRFHTRTGQKRWPSSIWWD